VEVLDLDAFEVRDGALYRDPNALGSAPLKRTSAGADLRFVAELPVDPAVVRRDQAQSDVAVGEIMKKPVKLEAALAARAKEAVTGAINITFDMSPSGEIRRRTKVTKVEVRQPDGLIETRTVTETLERRRVSRPADRPAS
jgi:hypothetical protein